MATRRSPGCSCCGYPNAKVLWEKIAICNACSLEETTREFEAPVNVQGTVVQGRITEITYKCKGRLCEAKFLGIRHITRT